MRFRPSEVAVLIGRGRGTTSGLTKAAEKYIRTKWVEVEKGFKPEVSSKYLTKGIEQEDAARHFYADILGLPNLYKALISMQIEELNFKGTCDCINGDIIIDFKCSWDPATFINAELTKDYEWQLRAYMMLYDKPKAELVYALMDIPDHLFLDEWKKYCWQNGILDDSLPEAEDKRAEMEAMYYYENNPRYRPEERIKVYAIERDAEQEETLIESLKMANEYYESLSLNMRI